MNSRFLVKKTSDKFENVILVLFSQFAQNTFFQIFKCTFIFVADRHSTIPNVINMESPIVTLDENNFKNLYFRNSISYSVFGRFGDFEVFLKNKSDF